MPTHLDILSIHGATVSGADVVTVAGSLNKNTSHRLRNHVASSGYTKDALILDLTDVTFLDSRGLGCIAEVQRDLADRSADLVLITADPRTLKILHVTGMDQLLRIKSTVEAALSPSPDQENLH